MTKTKFSAKVTNVPLGISGNIQDGDNEISVTTPTIRYFF
jgi:hypothetical protein